MWRFGLAVVVVLGACGGGDDPPDDQPPSCLPTCAGTRGYDARGYVLTGSFDWGARKLVASEDITLVTPSAVVELDSRVTVTRVHAGDTTLAHAQDDETGRLRVDLTPLAPGTEPVTFTVDLEAVPSDSMIASGARDDDPVNSRLLYTDSEPDRGLRWLVAKHDPSDRATWAVQLTVEADEDLIANGHRVSDTMAGGKRTVRYEIDDPIPTYLMAFAAGQLAHSERNTGRVPLAIWHRRGLVVDAEANLDVLAELMTVFEARVGPYPFESYAVVLVPQYGGGMENATITFNNELSGQGVPSFSLHAHELAHHWFGDWVTMHGYDDVWVKEGMATLLAAEAQRSRRDSAGLGRLMGTDFSFRPDDAVVDPSLTGLAKYTSGPYERAAWNITQIRRIVGEDAFWAGLKKVLADHALGTITGEEFVRSFAPALDEATILRFLAALPRTAVPSITIGATPTGTGTNLSLIVGDPDDTLIAPLDVTVVDAAGTAVVHPVQEGVQLLVEIPTGGYVAPDEGDVHPYWTSSFNVVVADFNSALRPLMFPTAAPAVTAFGARSASHQERTFSLGLPVLTSGSFAALVGSLDSTVARREATWDGCATLAPLPAGTEADDWRTVLGPLVTTPATVTFSTRYGRCGVTLASATLGAELVTASADRSPAGLLRVEYLISFDYGSAESFSRIGALATGAASLRLRDQAMNRLAQQTSGTSYSAVPPGERDAWKTFFRARLTDATSVTRFRLVWRGILGLTDVDALPAVGRKLHEITMSAGTQFDVVCGAVSMTSGSGASWTAFKEAAQPWNTLGSDAQMALANPTHCN